MDYPIQHAEYFSRREVLQFLIDNQKRTFGASEEECWWQAWKKFSFGLFDGDLGFLCEEFRHIGKFYGFYPVRGAKGYSLCNPRIGSGRVS